MMDTSRAWVTFLRTITSLLFLLLFRAFLADVSEAWPGTTFICLDKYGIPYNYSNHEEICCYGIYPRYNGIWEQKCCIDVKKPYSFGFEVCCKDGIKKNIPGIQSDVVCSGYTADITGQSDQDDAVCQLDYGKHFLFCESTRSCYDPKEKTCCPYSPVLHDTPSSEGICCGQGIFTLDDFKCRSSKQNYGFCKRKLKRRRIKKETKRQLEKICNSPHSYMIEIDKMAFKRNRNLYFTASVSQLLDQGFQQSIGNTTRHSIVLDIWMPSTCTSMLERSTFLVLSMTPPERFLQDLLYIYEKTDTIYKKYMTSQCNLDRIFQDLREIKEKCLVERRKSAHSERRMGGDSS